MFHLQIWQKRRIVNSTKPTIRRLNFCDIYFLKISVHVCISVAQQENAAAILPKIWKSPSSSLGEQGLSSMEKQKIFRAFCARKALRTLRSTQCPQNWLTMMEAPPRLELGNRGFAVRCLTTWLWRHIQDLRTKCPQILLLERATRLELATSTLARWRSTG